MARGKGNGCRTCKQRRIKCDERQPICFQCEKSKRYCPGLDSPFRYQYGDSQQRETLVKALIDDNDSRRGSKSPPSSRSLSAIRSYATAPSPQQFPLSENEMLSCSLIIVLEHPYSVGAQLQHLGSFFHYLPALIGQNKTLDLSISCVLAAYNGILHPDARNQVIHLKAFCTALSSLREDLTGDKPATSLALCSSALLALYDVLDKSPPNAVFALISGCSKLVRFLGPESFKSGFELSMFRTQYRELIMCSLLAGTPCFLNDSKWIALMRTATLGETADEHVATELWITVIGLPEVHISLRQILRVFNPDQGECKAVLDCLVAIRHGILLHSGAIESLLSQIPVRKMLDAASTHDFDRAGCPALSENDLSLAYNVVKAINLFYGLLITINITIIRLLRHARSLSQSSDLSIEELECQAISSAEWILSSIPFARTLVPFGAMYITMMCTMAYGILPDKGAKDQLVSELNSMATTVGYRYTEHDVMVGFESMTGGIGLGESYRHWATE